MQKKIIKVGDLFLEDFFIGLKDIIFEESFDDFFYRRVKEIKTYAGYDESLWYPIEEDMRTSDIYPISYEKFLDMYNKIGCCTLFVDTKLFCIKFLIKELFENPKSEFLNNENFFIKIKKNIIINQYENTFNSEFFETKLSYISKKLGLVISNTKSIDLYAQNIICYCFDFIQLYLEILAENLLIDNALLLNSYIPEVKSKFLLKKKNRTKSENYIIKGFIDSIKEKRNLRFKLSSGKPKIEIIGYFPQDYKSLNKEIKRIREEYNNHKYIKEQLRKIKKGVNIEEIQQNIYNYMRNKSSEQTYITLDGEFITKDNDLIIEDFSPELIQTINNYIKLASQDRYKEYGYIISISDVIRYTLLEISGELKYFENSTDILKVINTFFERRKTQNRFYVSNEISPVYNLSSFKEKYIQFFKH